MEIFTRTGGDLWPNMGGGSGGGGGYFSPDGSYEPSDGFWTNTDLRITGGGGGGGTGGLYPDGGGK